MLLHILNIPSHSGANFISQKFLPFVTNYRPKTLTFSIKTGFALSKNNYFLSFHLVLFHFLSTISKTSPVRPFVFWKTDVIICKRPCIRGITFFNFHTLKQQNFPLYDIVLLQVDYLVSLHGLAVLTCCFV